MKLVLPRTILYVGKDHGPRQSPAVPRYLSRVAAFFAFSSHHLLTVHTQHAVRGVVHVRMVW
jgi:hypothetical protein